MAKETKALDMTHGSPTKLLVLFALPMLVGGLFQLCYNMVDTIVLGRFVSPEALASVGAAQSTNSIFYHANMALTNSVSILISQAWGAKDEFRVRQTTANIFKITLICSAVMGLIGFFGAEPMMRLLGTPENIIDGSITYIRIICGLNIAPLMYNSLASMLRAVGDSRTPLYFLILCCLLNVGLDLLFVVMMDDGIAGVAWATIISQTLSVVLCLTYMWKKYPQLHFGRTHLRSDRKLTKNYWGITFPMLIQNLSLSAGMLVLSSIINPFGSDIVAAYTVGSKAEALTTVAFVQFTFSFSVFAGQNYGAKQYDRISRGLKSATTLVLALVAVSMTATLILAPHIAALFVDTDNAVILENATRMIRIEGAFMPALAMILLLNACLRGIGHVKPTFYSCMVEMCCKMGFAAALSPIIGPTGIWLAAPMGWLLGCIPDAWHYFFSGWKQKAIENDKKAILAKGEIE